MIISKFQIDERLITLETGELNNELNNSDVVYFFVCTCIKPSDRLISFRTFIFDDALKEYLSIIKITLESLISNDYRPKTNDDFLPLV